MRLIHLVLRACTVELVENIRPEDGLLDWLYGKGLISARERGRVAAAGDQFSQMSHLVGVLITKDDDALDEMIGFLQREGGQAHIVRRLEQTRKNILDGKCVHGGKQFVKPGRETAGASQSSLVANYSEANHTSLQITSDRCEVNQSSVQRITNILTDDPVVLTKWPIVMHELLVNHVDIYDVKSFLQSGNVVNAVRLTLERWISKSASGSNPLSTLIAKLELHELNAAAGRLRREMGRL